MKSCRIVSAKQNGGKTTYMEKLIANTESPMGFISIKDNIGYSIMNIETGEMRRYLSRKPEFPERFKSWYIDAAVFDWIFDTLKDAEDGSSIFIDEVGKLELGEKGFYKTLCLLKDKDIDMTIAVRDSFVEEVIDFFSLKNATVVSVPFLSSL